MVELIPAKVAPVAAALSRGLISTQTVRTEADGSFQAPALVPGAYVVRLTTRRAGMERPVAEFSKEDEDAVDQDFATSWWPGVSERESAGISTVEPGGVTKLGSITIRKEMRHRIHFVVRGCEPGDLLDLRGQGDDFLPPGVNLPDQLAALVGVTQTALPCKDLLIRGIRPGSYRFIATTAHSAGVAQVVISDRNIRVTLPLTPNGDVLGHVVMVSGAPPPPRQPGLQGARNAFVRPDEKGNFVMTNVQCLPSSLRLVGLDDRYYIKELRVDGVAVSGETSLCAGSRLEVVLDDKVAALTLSVNDGDKPAGEAMIFVQKWPESALDRVQPQGKADKSGVIHLTKLAPGDYRVLAMRQIALADGDDPRTIASQLWDRATKVALDPGDTKSISVKLIDLFE
jgi:hypothetical protein